MARGVAKREPQTDKSRRTQAADDTPRQVTMSKARGRSSAKGKDKQSKGRHEDEADQKEASQSFQVLPQDVCKELMELDIDDMQRKIIEIFKLNSWVTDLQEAALADYYTGAVWWAKEQGFNDQQMSAFFTAVYSLLENVKVKHMALVDNMRELKQMLVGVGTEPSTDVVAGGLECLDVAQGHAVTKYIVSSLFQHYKLYELMFSTNTQAQEIIGHDVEIVVPKAAAVPFPPPLDEGIEEEKLHLYIKPPAPLATEEETEKAEKEDDADITAINLESNIFSQLTAQDVQEVVESVTAKMLGGLQHEVAVKLREKENALLAKINKMYKISSPLDRTP